MKIHCLAFATLLCSQRIASQVPELFIVDSNNLSVKQTLPFDRPFILGFRGTGAKSIYAAFMFEWTIKGHTRTLKSKMKKNEAVPVFTHIKNENVLTVEIGADLYIPAQPPNKNFVILLAHRFDGDLLDEVLMANWYLYTGDVAKATSVLKSLDAKVKSKVRAVPGIPVEKLKDISAFAFNWQKPPNAVSLGAGVDVGASVDKGYQSFYTNSLNSFYSKLNLKSQIPANITSVNLMTIMKSIATSKLSSTELGPLVSIIARNWGKSLLEGIIALQKDIHTSIVKDHQLSARLKNLNVSLLELEKLIQYSEWLEAQLDNATLRQLIKDLNTLLTDIKSNRDNLKEVNTEVLSAIAKETNLFYNTWAFSHNELWDLKTRGSYQLIPDIGLASIIGIGNAKNEVILRPYIGVSIYFRPIDKSVPYKYFDRKYRFFHRFSANLGVTVGKMEQGEFSDFFSGMNLLVGGNYKITRAFSFSAGVAFLKQNNANRAINDKITSLNPYVGLSFDLDFTNSIQKLTGKLSL